MGFNIDTLPSEVLFHLLKFLNLSDRLALSSTCHRLYEVVIDCDVDGGRQVTVQSDSVELNVEFRRIRQLVFKDVDVTFYRDLWLLRGDGINTLQLHNCDINEPTFVGILDVCPNLQNLSVVNCNNLFMSGNLFDNDTDTIIAQNSLSRIVELNLSHNRYLSDSLFNRIVNAAVNLQSLNLSNCQVSFHPAIYRRFYPPHSPPAPSTSIFTFQNVLQFFRQRCRTIKSLDISHTLIDSTSLTELAEIPNLELEKLILASCEQLTSVGIEALCRHQRSLITLDLGQCMRCNDQVLNIILENLRNLQHLHLRSCRFLSVFPTIQNPTKLLSLDLSGCENLRPETIMQMSVEGIFIHLTWLCLNACPVNEATIISIVEKAVQLRHLDLSSCREGVSDNSFREICRNLRWLRYLNVSWCDALTDTALGVEQNSPSTPTLSNIVGLKHLDMCACVQLTDTGFLNSLKFIELQSLNLTLCKHLSDLSLMEIGKFNPSLEKLILGQCHAITDEGLTNAVRYLSRLKHLDIQGCKLVTDNFLVELVDLCRELRYLDVSMCFGISREGTRTFQKDSENNNRKCIIHQRHINP